ncbi:unnamed protein product [Amoebophrya sp. A120]|nr:unnamed protein product [Amoebophrya sp. A120]|eukprot:GSA120T00011448001.1
MQHKPATVLAQVGQRSGTRVGQFRHKNSRLQSEVRRKLSLAGGGAQLLFLLYHLVVQCKRASAAVEEETSTTIFNKEEHVMLASRVGFRSPMGRSGPQQVLDHARRYEAETTSQQFLVQSPGVLLGETTRTDGASPLGSWSRADEAQDHPGTESASVSDLRFVPTHQEVETASGGGIGHQPATRTSEMLQLRADDAEAAGSSAVTTMTTTASTGTTDSAVQALALQLQQMEQELRVLREATTRRFAEERNATDTRFAKEKNETERRFVTVRNVGSINEIILQRLLAVTIARTRTDGFTSVVFLVVGFIAAVVGTILPTALVFFPTIQEMPVVVVGDDEYASRGRLRAGAEGEDDGESTTGEQPQQELPAQQEAGAAVVETETYYFLPEDFVDTGTLSNVCCSHGSAQGKIWSSCLVCYAMSMLLSRYTFKLYPDWCPFNQDDDAPDLATAELGLGEVSSFHEVAYRMLWLLVPNILFILLAAIPTVNGPGARSGQRNMNSNTPSPPPPSGLRPVPLLGESVPHVQGVNPDNLRENATSHASNSTAGSAQEAFLTRNRGWLKFMHVGLAGIAVGGLLFAETLQLFVGEGVHVVNLFTMSGESAMNAAWHDASWLEHRMSPSLFTAETSECHGMWPPEKMLPKIFRFRVVTILLAFVSGVCCAVSSLALDKIRSEVVDDKIVRMQKGALVPTRSTSLFLPRLVYTFELVTMLLVWTLPFYPALINEYRYYDDFRALNQDITTQVGTIYRFHSDALPQCGTYFDLAAPRVCSDLDQNPYNIHLYNTGDPAEGGDSKWMWWQAEQSGNVPIVNAGGLDPALPWKNWLAWTQERWHWREAAAGLNFTANSS